MLLEALLMSLAVQAVAVKRSIIATADPGGFSGVSEGKYILGNMTNTENITQALPYCALAVEGQIYGVDVTLITTGIGHDNSAACMENVVTYYIGTLGIKDVVYLGTSGFSPVMGGVFESSQFKAGCSEGSSRKLGDIKPTRIGDICISPISLLNGCGFCESNDESFNGQCTSLKCSGRNQSDVFGKCSFSPKQNSASFDLANSYIAASQQALFPDRPQRIEDYASSYWGQVLQGLGIMGDVPTDLQPTIYNYTMCAEAAEYDLWTGLPKDQLCREYTSQVIDNAINSASTANDVTCVSALEGPGWMKILLNEAATGGPIPFTGIRAHSDYVYWPMVRDPSTGHLVSNDSWCPPSLGTLNDFMVQGYRHAINIATTIVLKHFELQSKN
eukprot:TRINITY_DN8957_c0_g3_i1.p1 TRINITY_DN8957_c0_g3~~TRINITY_DN8957_c0_g3_i1.p1  ORF type:complete len:388 (+),score=54.69 TRINITY_DN8957_c0_g3_i1:82-1245(+)